MAISLSNLLEPQTVPNLDSVENRDEAYGRRTTSAVIVVGSHIRSFYRLLVIIVFLFVLIVFGIISIIMGYFKKNACDTTFNVSQMLILFGIADIIICGIIMLIAIARVMCCYHRRDLICYCLFIGLFVLLVIFGIVNTIVSKGVWIRDFAAFLFNFHYQGYCAIDIQIFALLIKIYFLLLIFSPILYSYVQAFKSQCKKTDDSTTQFTRLV